MLFFMEKQCLLAYYYFTFSIVAEYEKMKDIPAGTIKQTILHYGDKGAWPKLEVGMVDAVEFGEIFSSECSYVVSFMPFKLFL